MEIKIKELLKAQDRFWNKHNTIAVSRRKQLLKSLRNAIVDREDQILKTVYDDLKKPAFEVLATEYHLVLSEINNTLKHIDNWSRPKNVRSSLFNFPSRAKILSQAYGRVLIIAPWNYPFALAMIPLIGAVAAGNTIVLKPSELSQNTSKLIQEIIDEVFPLEHAVVVTGDKHIAKSLLEFRWDYIFFTGSTQVGKYVYQKAAEHLTPVTLELGGKSPCIVDKNAPIKLSAKRIAWGKFLNAGQSCIAADYLIVHQKIKDQVIEALIASIKSMKWTDNKPNPNYAQIINSTHKERLLKALEGQKILYGARVSGNYLSPTLVDEPALNSPLMQQEIFGPILPVLSYDTFGDLERIINTYEKPLALYVFSTQKAFVNKTLEGFSFGGGVVNDTMVHYINKNLPFGGVGHSGMGAYHGSSSFETFSHQKSIVKRGLWLDIPLRYPPYTTKKLSWLRFFQKFL